MKLERFQDRWQHLDDLLQQALGLPPEEREDFCTTACGEDLDLKNFLLELVTAANDCNDDDIFVRHFKTERQVHASLSHPYIPALVDAGQLSDGQPYLVAEYVDGIPIDEYCDTHKLTRHQRIALVEKVCHAVQHAHSKLVLHLDIKPNNILMEQDGMPRLLDFGVSRLVDEAGSGHDAFTPEYASPEQLQHELPTTASDIYALGGLLYRLVEGKPPFQAPRFAPTETKIAIREALAARIAQEAMSSGADRELRAIIRKAMAVSPTDRYPSVSALAQDLASYRGNLPVSALPRTFTYRLRKYLRRHAAVLSLGATTIAVLLAFGLRESQLREKSEREAETTRQVSAFLVGLFEDADPRQARDKETTARELVAKGAEKIATSFDADPAIKVRLLQTLASVHRHMSLFDEAEKMYLDALALSRDAQPPDELVIAETQTQLGDMLRRLDRLEDADSFLNEALAVRRELLPPNSEPIAYSLKELGLLRTEQARYVEAEAMLRDRFGRDHPTALNALRTITLIHSQQGNYHESEPVLLEILQLNKKIYGDDHPRVSDVYNQLGGTYADLGNFSESLRHYDLSIEIERRAQRDDPMAIARPINNKAWTYVDMEDFANAEPLFKRSLELRQQLYDDNHPAIARAKYNLGSLYVMMDDHARAEHLLREAMQANRESLPEGRQQLEKSWYRFAQIAADYYAKALAEYDSSEMASHPRVANLLYDMALLALDETKPETAIAYLERALEIQQSKLPGDHPHLARTLALSGEAHVRAGRTEEGKAMLEKGLSNMREGLSRESPSLRRAQVALNKLSN